MRKILLVEDEPILRENTCALLEAYGFECMVAENAEAGLQILKLVKPDLIICDIMMPEIDGYQTKIQINNNPDWMTIPFIFLSGKSANHDVDYGIALGAACYLIKPFKIRELVGAINDCFL